MSDLINIKPKTRSKGFKKENFKSKLNEKNNDQVYEKIKFSLNNLNQKKI